MKNFATLFIALFASCLLTAQITLDQDDFPYAGFNRDYISDDGSSVDVGNAGANQSFDFSILNNVYDTFNIEFAAPANTPFPNQHPGSNLAILFELEKDSVTQQTVLELWQFAKTTNTESNFIGVSIKIDTGYIFSNSPPTSTIDVNSPFIPELTMVSAQNIYQSSNTYSGGWTVTLGNLKHDEVISREIEVDAYGTFSNPWQQFDALRFKVREIEVGYDTLNGQLDDTWADTSHFYEYWTKDFGFWVARAYTDENYSMIYSVDVASILYPVGIENSADEEIWSIQPNPAKNDLFVDIGQNRDVNYRILDASGKKIKEGRLINPGRNSIDISNLRSSFYIIELFNDHTKYAPKKFLVE